MFLIYRKETSRRIDWKSNRMTASEMAIIQMWAPELADEADRQFRLAFAARAKKLTSRHYFENKVINTLEVIASIIEKKEGFKPIFFKEV
jgi:hypothetical protein